MLVRPPVSQGKLPVHEIEIRISKKKEISAGEDSIKEGAVDGVIIPVK